MQLLSINAGIAQRLQGSQEVTGIVKKPIAGPVSIGVNGIENDAIINKKYHGGPDQALYIYTKPDYDWWETERKQTIPPGMFGENLTISGIESATLCVGDRLTIGDLVIEVTAHRAPCNTFARRMNDPRIVKAFFRAGRPGAYARIITPGTVEAGMAITLTPYEGERVDLADLLAGHINPDAQTARRYLKAPIAERLRTEFEKHL